MADRPDAAAVDRASGARGKASAAAMACAIMALGAFVVFDALTGLAGPGYAQVGPGVFPVVVGAALELAGLGLLVQSLRGRWRVVWVERDSGTPAHSRNRSLRDVLLVAAALALNLLLIAPLGFVAASAALFAGVAAAFGSRRHVLDAALGLGFAAAIYFALVHALGLHLPAGSLWESLPWRR